MLSILKWNLAKRGENSPSSWAERACVSPVSDQRNGDTRDTVKSHTSRYLAHYIVDRGENDSSRYCWYLPRCQFQHKA